MSLELAKRSADIADTVTTSMLKLGFMDAGIFVFGPSLKDPAAIRTTGNFGFGLTDPSSQTSFANLSKEAADQARLANFARGKTAAELAEYMNTGHSNASYYDIDLAANIVPAFAVDGRSGLTVVSLVPDGKLPNLESAKICEDAITQIDNGAEPTFLRDAAQFIRTCMTLLVDASGSEQNTCFALISLPSILESIASSGPTIVCSQGCGNFKSMAGYSVVRAKVNAVAKTGYASGDPRSTNSTFSNKQGAIPIEISKIGAVYPSNLQRIVGIGGLPKGNLDVDIATQAMREKRPLLVAHQIDSLSRQYPDSN
ncbi:MAG: hypothetical protein WAV40_05365 [Microgenomates group bacterium]